MTYLTDFADQAVIIPLVLAVAIVLALQGWTRGAITWLLTIAGVFTVTLAGKLMCLACTPIFGPFDIHSPSGHVAAATVTAGGLAAIVSRHRSTIIPVALLAAIIIGVTRLLLGMHTLPEVITGGIIGLAGAAALLRFAGPLPRLRLAPLLTTIVLTAGVFHGFHLPAEAAIRHTALAAARFIPACQQAVVTARPQPAPHPSMDM